MTAPTYVGTKDTNTTFVPGPGLPILTHAPQLISDQPTLTSVITAAGKTGVELRFYTTGKPTPGAAPRYVQTVNSTAPDASGNIDVAGGGGGGILPDQTYGGNPGTPWRTTRLPAGVLSTWSNLVETYVNGVLSSWFNEAGLFRGTPHVGSPLDALVRAIGRNDWAGNLTHNGVGYAALEILDALRTTQKWGRHWMTGGLYRNGILHHDTLYWVSGQGDPTIDTSGKWGFGVFAQSISPTTWVIAYLHPGDTPPAWLPVNRSEIRWLAS